MKCTLLLGLALAKTSIYLPLARTEATATIAAREAGKFLAGYIDIPTKLGFS